MTCQYLKSIGDFADLDVDGFVDDEPLRAASSPSQDYGKACRYGEPSVLGGPIRSATAGQRPCAGQRAVARRLGAHADRRHARRPLKAVRDARAKGEQVRAAYVPDAELGTRWFADKAVWVRDGARLPARSQRLPAPSGTIAAHPAARPCGLPSRR